MPPPARLNCAVIEAAQRDSTQDWVVPRGTVPTVAELEARIDEAVVIARASEDGVREVGEMALDAAKQAKKAAEMAESASAAAVEAASKAGADQAGAGGPAGPVPDLEPPSLPGWSPKSAPPPGSSAEGQTPRDERTREVVIDPLTRFNRRADAVAARLEKLQQVPV
ncbi:MAG TPA: hypothetical protein VIT89_00695 [Solirubrobacterales bacterium]